jgi:hypothetical protein
VWARLICIEAALLGIGNGMVVLGRNKEITKISLYQVRLPMKDGY